MIKSNPNYVALIIMEPLFSVESKLCRFAFSFKNHLFKTLLNTHLHNYSKLYTMASLKTQPFKDSTKKNTIYYKTFEPSRSSIFIDSTIIVLKNTKLGRGLSQKSIIYVD